MKCPGCDYELWNLKAGPCPECGRPFKPSEFDFLPNAVKFCCPRCTQPYYGTSENGQLVPDEFDCVSCGLHVKVDDMLLLPADALGSRAPTRAMNPWLDESRSTNRKYFSALGMSIGQPGKMLEATPAIGSVGPATTFALLNFVVAGLLTLALAVVLAFTGGGLDREWRAHRPCGKAKEEPKTGHQREQVPAARERERLICPRDSLGCRLAKQLQQAVRADYP
ncbi:MAG: hypothetical protein AAFV77_11455 [Planctomycetota bacterium]